MNTMKNTTNKTMTTELLDLFDEAKRIIDKQEELINRQQSIIKTMQQALQGVELNELLLKKQIADIQEELLTITNDYIDSKSIIEGGV